MQAIRSKYNQMPIEDRNILLISLGIATAFFLYGLVVYQDLLNSTTLRDVITNGIPFFMIVMALISATLVWQGQIGPGAKTLVASTTVGMILVPMMAEGYGLVTGLVILAVMLGVASQVYRKYFMSFIYIGGILVAVNLLVDSFWPFERTGIDEDVIIGRILGGVLVLLIGILIVRRIRELRLQDKLVLFAIVITVVPLFVITYISQQQTEQALINAIKTQTGITNESGDANSLLEPVRAQSRNNLVAGIIIAALAVSFAVYISGVIAAPINRLTQVAERVAGGDLSAQAEVESQDEIGTLADTFNLMTTRLRQTLADLEQRVTDRTRAIETSAVVGRRLSNVLNTQELVRTVVDELQQAFHYYHVQIFLIEHETEGEFADGEENRVLRLAGGTGEAGRQLIARGHKIPYGKGLVGRSAASGTIVFVPDTTRDPEWLPNPLLPETRAEVALPLMIGDQVLGALDIQHNVENSLAQQDLDLLSSIANQVAISLRNSRLYEEARHQAEREARISTIIEQIQQTRSIDQALQVAAREIGRSIGNKATLARLYRQKTIDSADTSSSPGYSEGDAGRE